MNRFRILIADDHLLFCDGLRKILEPDHHVVGTVHDGLDVVPAILSLEPDLVLLDLSLPGRNGIEIARQARDLGLAAKVLVLTMHNDTVFAVEALRAGAAGFMLKEASGEELLHAIDEVMDGRTYLDTELRRLAGM
ncbi:MAG TPA: response regulator transcription factor [Gemmatimonadales bacterium]|nr:response regulator transcription factor [Gemmatimonadales bacterium]